MSPYHKDIVYHMYAQSNIIGTLSQIDIHTQWSIRCQDALEWLNVCGVMENEINRVLPCVKLLRRQQNMFF